MKPLQNHNTTVMQKLLTLVTSSQSMVSDIRTDIILLTKAPSFNHCCHCPKEFLSFYSTCTNLWENGWSFDTPSFNVHIDKELVKCSNQECLFCAPSYCQTGWTKVCFVSVWRKKSHFNTYFTSLPPSYNSTVPHTKETVS